MKIAVVDDEKYAREDLCHEILEIEPTAEITTISSGISALEDLEKNEYDLIFLDIHLGDMSGTTVASIIRKMSDTTYIVFATAFSEYGVKAFELGVDDYILKPFDPKRIRQIIDKVKNSNSKKISYLNESKVTVQKIAVTVNRSTTLIDIEDIIYIETSGTGRHCILHTNKGEFTTTTKMSEYEQKLTPFGFFRTHKTCVVQLNKISHIFPWSNNTFALKLEESDAILPVGREQFKKLRLLFNR